MIVDDDIRYLDLGLPSGTLWAASFLKNEEGRVRFMSHAQASQLKLPTKQQFYELKMYTKRDFASGKIDNRLVQFISFIGPKLPPLVLPFIKYDENQQIDEQCYTFWLRERGQFASMLRMEVNENPTLMVNAVLLVK